ncbi:MAG: hypothetical protein AMS21_06045 [Gemmatimonas sp. SG8_38_2]|nr:MAG: hypothetical protein AMS21_06045 [Gemmatimonas sp. SG8_38_2]
MKSESYRWFGRFRLILALRLGLPARQNSGGLRRNLALPSVAESAPRIMKIALLRNRPAGAEFSSPGRK